MPAGDWMIIKLHRDIVIKCARCKGDLWYIVCDKPEFGAIEGFECATCGDIIEIYISDSARR